MNIEIQMEAQYAVDGDESTIETGVVSLVKNDISKDIEFIVSTDGEHRFMVNVDDLRRALAILLS